MAKKIDIGGELHSVATGNIVADAKEIKYRPTGKEEKTQAQVNDELIEAVGSGGGVDARIASAVNAAKAEIIGNATSACDTLGEAEALISAETSARQSAISNVIGDATSDYNTLGKLEDKIQAEATRAEAAEGALDSRVDTLEDAVGTGGSIDSRISDAVATETTRAQGAESQLSSGKADKATTLAGYGITDAYTKSETYTKTEVNGLVDTPHQNYVTVAATSQTTAATDVLPASGQAADTIYRVSNWDGSANSGAGAFDVSCYSEYAWDDASNPNKYVFLCVKSQIGEVFDISVYNNNAKYADLAAALNDGANIPQSLQKGGMSVKFVCSSDNKYVQYFLPKNTWSDSVADWEKINLETEVVCNKLNGIGCAFSEFQVINNKFITTNNNNNKVIINSSYQNYIQLPIDDIDKAVKITGFSYIPSTGTEQVFTKLIFFDANDECLSEISTATNDIIFLEKPSGATSCYFSMPKAYVEGIVIRSLSEEEVNAINVPTNTAAITVLQQEANNIGKEFTIIGNNNNYVSASQVYKDAQPGHKYRIYLVNPNVGISNITNIGSFLFNIKLGETNVKIIYVTDPLPTLADYYDIENTGTSPVDITIGGRCNLGEILRCKIEDITFASSVNSRVTEVNGRVTEVDTKVQTLDERAKNMLDQSLTDNVLYETVIRNGTVANTSNTNCVAHKYCIPFGDYDKIIIHTNRPNGTNKVYRYGYSLCYEPQILSSVSENRHTDVDVAFANNSNEIIRNNAIDKAFAFIIAEYDSITGTISPLRVSDFDGYNVWLEMRRTSEASIDALADMVNFKKEVSHTLTQVSDFVSGNIQATGTVLAGGGLTSPDWIRCRKGNILHIDYPSTVTYNETDYTLRMRLVTNALPKADTTPSQIRVYDSGGAIHDVSINSDLYHYFKFTLFLYSGSSQIGGELAASIWASLSSLNVTVTIEGGASKGYYPLDEMESRLADVEGADGIGTDIVRLNDISLTKQRFTQLKRTVRGSISINQPNLILAHFSDLHEDRTNLERIIQYCDYWQANIDDILCTGDIVQNSFNETTDERWTSLWRGAQNILIAIGNHDTAHYSGTYDWTQHVGADAYNRYIKDYVSNWGVTQPDNAAANGYCYYYKDYSSQKVRLIVLDVMGWDATQLDWFIATMASAKTAGLSVVAAIHYSAPMDMVKCSFNSLNGSEFYDHIPNDALDAVDAFVSGDNGGEFVCWLTGHTHKDYFGIATNHPNQLIVTVSSAQCQREGNQGDNVQRVEGTRTQDLFNIVSIDTHKKYVTMFRVGADLDMMLRHIGTISYDYANKQLVWND